MNRRQQLEGFDFDNDPIFDDRIGPESGLDADVVIDYRDGLPAHRTQTPAAEFIRQDGLINGFQPARAKRRMNAESAVDTLRGNSVLSHTSLLWFLAKALRRKESIAHSGPVDSSGRLDRCQLQGGHST